MSDRSYRNTGRWVNCSPTTPFQLIILLVVVGFPGVFSFCFDKPVYRLIKGGDILPANSGFAANGEPHPDDLPSVVLSEARSHFWRNYTPKTGVRPAVAQNGMVHIAKT